VQEGIAAQYDRNAAGYDDAARFNAMAAERLVAALPPGEPRDLLDVGCGTGFAALAMLGRFPSLRRVTGLDVSAEMLERFRAKLAAASGAETRLVRADLLRDGLPEGPYDAVLCSMVLHWLGERRAEAIAAMAAALRPGGVLALVAPGPGHDREYADLLRGLDPPVPAPVVDVFDRAQVFPEAVERALIEAGTPPLDVWVERRRRRVDPARYMARIEAVGSHTWAELMGPAEQAAMLGRIRSAVAAASPGGVWRYTFTKTFAVARRA
jgi:SAM-dependent methyltransferase